MQPIEINKNPISEGTVIGHVHLKTANLQKVYDFYVGILGFNVISRTDSVLFISAGNYHHHLAFNTWHTKDGQAPAENMTGLYHVALKYPTRQALGDALRRLLNAEWKIQGVNDHGTHEALYVLDPDNNGLELCWDRPEAEWPLDEKGQLAFMSKPINLHELLNEAYRLEDKQI